MTFRWRRGLASLAAGLLLAPPPAAALSADPGRSRADAQAPGIAPGVWGSAPVHGVLGSDGSLQLYAPVSGIRTGYALYDALLRQFLGPALELRTSPAAGVLATTRQRRMRVEAVVAAGPAVAEVPLLLRVTRHPKGLGVRTFFSVPLAPYGVVHPLGRDPGRVSVAVIAYFPQR